MEPVQNSTGASQAQQTAVVYPRDQLLGKTLRDGWLLAERLDKKDGDSGENFGSGYLAKRPD